MKTAILDPTSSEMSREVAQVCLGIPNFQDSEEVTARVVDNVTDFLKLFAREFEDRARSYNAWKHGLAVRPGAAVLNVSADGDEFMSVGFGDSLSFLEFESGDSQKRKWRQATEWIRWRRTVLLTYFGSLMLESIWESAKKRYTGNGHAPTFAPRPDVIDPSILDAENDPPALKLTVDIGSKPTQLNIEFDVPGGPEAIFGGSSNLANGPRPDST